MASKPAWAAVAPAMSRSGRVIASRYCRGRDRLARMQLGMIGLGPDGRQHGPPARTGRARVRRLRRLGRRRRSAHRRRPASAPTSMEQLVAPLDAAAPRLDHGARRRRRPDRSTRWPRCSALGDTIIDGGNSWYHDDIRRALPLAADHGIDYVDVGVSGGVFGLERGYCLMIGGPPRSGRATGADLRHASPPASTPPPRTPARRSGAGRRRPSADGCTAAAAGAGHFVKMVHNGIEYGMMAAYAEGLNVLAKAGIGRRGPRRDAETAPLEHPRVLPVRPRPGADHRGVAAGVGGLQLAARPHRRGARPRPAARRLRGPRQRLRRGSLDASPPPSTKACRCPCSSAALFQRFSLARPRPTWPTRCCRRCAPGSAGTSRVRTSDGSTTTEQRRTDATTRPTRRPTPSCCSAPPATSPSASCSRRSTTSSAAAS